MSAGPPGTEWLVAKLLQLVTERSTMHAGLPSADNNNLLVPRKASVAAPVAWNSLPTEIRSISSTTTLRTNLTRFYLLHFTIFLNSRLSIIRLETMFQANIGITVRRDLAVFTRLAESEPIWIKSGALGVNCWGLALA